MEFPVHEVGSFSWGAAILTWVPSINPMAQGKPPTRNILSLISSRSARMDGNLTKSSLCVTRQTTRLTVDASNPRKVSPITCRNEPEARTRTCIMAEKAWFLFVCGVISKLIVGQWSDLERSDHGTNLEQRPFNFFIIRWIQIYTTYLTMDNFICWIASG